MNAREQAFVDAYLGSAKGNATAAARAAGYSARSAGNQGGRMMKKDEVLKAIKARQAKTAEKVEITREYLVEELRVILKHVDTANPDRIACIREMAKMMGFNSSKLTLEGKLTYEQLLEGSRKLDADVEPQRKLKA